MNKLKTGLMIFIVVMVILVWAIPMASAENATIGSDLTTLTPSSTVFQTEPFIMVNPISNHTVDETFFINGTTNLPVSNETLLLEITADFNSGRNSPFDPFYTSNLSIFPGENGTNTWSVNATASQWFNYHGPESALSYGGSPGYYKVTVVTRDPFVYASDTKNFFILSSKNRITPNHVIPVASFGYGIGETEPSETKSVTVNFFDTSKNSPTSWLWSFGDGDSSTSQYPTHTYRDAGRYPVTLTVTNAAGSNTTSVFVLITASGVSATTTTGSPDHTPATTQSPSFSLVVSIAALVGVVISNSCLKKRGS